MYCKEKLIEQNKHRYCFEVTDKDVEVATAFSEAILKRSTGKRPVPGESVKVSTKYGDFYPAAHIQHTDTDKFGGNVCLSGSDCYVGRAIGDRLFFNACGGPWEGYDVNNFQPTDTKRETHFWTWGSRGAGASHGLHFSLELPVWEYKDPEPLFGIYTTEKYRKFRIYQRTRPEYIPYRYLSDGKAWETEIDLEAWRRTYKGKVFRHGNARVVFCYRIITYMLNKAQWDVLDFPEDTRRCNGIIAVKVNYDHDEKIIHEYRYTNSGISDQSLKPFQKARRTIHESNQQIRSSVWKWEA